jgi:hypothetical protein
MDSNTTTGVEVTVAAIDGGYLVLESLNDKTQFQWPLDKIPRPLEIGSRLTLSLQKDSISVSPSNDTVIRKTAPNAKDRDKNREKEDQMRRLLEELVN